MSDHFRETTSTSWFDRIIESIKGVLVGFVLIIVAVVVLFWNEGRAVQTAKSLAEGASNVVTVKPDSVDAGNDGKLVAVTGEVTTKETLTDASFGASANAVALRRKVEMYQWQEQKESKTRKKLGGGEETTTEYNYKTDWSAEAVDSSKFKETSGHSNPDMKYKSNQTASKEATLGGFKVPESLITKIDAESPLAVTDDALKSAEAEVAKRAVVNDGKVYVGKDPAKPEVGDYRVTFTVVKPTTVSIIAKQASGSFDEYPTKAGDKILMLKVGSHSATEMFKAAQSANSNLTWVLRFVGWLVMVLGFYLVFRPLETMADVIPFVGSLLGAGLLLFAVLISSVISSIVVAIAWIFYRPLLGIGLLVAGAAIFGALTYIGRKRLKRA